MFVVVLAQGTQQSLVADVCGQHEFRERGSLASPNARQSRAEDLCCKWGSGVSKLPDIYLETTVYFGWELELAPNHRSNTSTQRFARRTLIGWPTCLTWTIWRLLEEVEQWWSEGRDASNQNLKCSWAESQASKLSCTDRNSDKFTFQQFNIFL